MKSRTTAIRKLNGAIETNELIYWVRRIPFAKKFITINAYSNPKYKRFFKILATSKQSSGVLLRALLMVFVFTMIASSYWNNWIDSPINLQFSSWEMMYGFTVLATHALIGQRKIALSDNKFKWLVVDQFRGNPLDYYHYELIKTMVIHSATGLIITLPILFRGINGWALISLVPLLMVLSREGLKLRSSRTVNKKVNMWMAILRSLAILGFALVSFMVLPHKLWWFIACAIVLITGSANFILEFRRCDVLLIMSINKQVKDKMRLSSDRNREIIELQAEASRIDEDVDVTKDQYIVESMVGFRMINKIFYSRHKHIWQKPLKIMSKIVGVVGIVILCVALVARIMFPEETRAFADLRLSNPLYLSKLFLIVIGVTNFTETIARSFFMNCDSALLHYAFYRRREIIWKQYLSRMVNLVLLNLIPILLMLVVLILLCFIGVIPFSRYFMYLIINVILFSIFITTINLMLYYMIQPYNASMEMKSPLYAVISGLMYMLVFQIPSDVFVTLGQANEFLILGLMVFIVLSCLLVYLFGVKTFRLRKA